MNIDQPQNLMSVAYEVCGAFRSAIGNDEPFCSACGHLADDHEPDEAQVMRLPLRPVRRQVPARKAS
jgi:hypothetical protein